MDLYERYHACNNCMNRRVSLLTVEGKRHEGVIVGVDERNVYLQVSEEPGDRAETQAAKKRGKAKTSGYWGGYGGYGGDGYGGFGFGGGGILTLALFSLLAIALI